jgi:hypothetical protein
VINHDSQAENPGFDNVISQFDKLRTDMNARFDNVICQFDKLRTDMNAGFDNVISQFDMFRTNMDAGFEALHATLVRKLIQMGVLNTVGMIAILCIDRWWL